MTRFIPQKDKTYTKQELMRLADDLAILYLHRYDLPMYSGLLQTTARRAVNLRLAAANIHERDEIPADIAGIALNDAEASLRMKAISLVQPADIRDVRGEVETEAEVER